MDVVVVIIHRYAIIFIDIMNRCDICFFFCIDTISSIIILCIVNYFWWILMRWNFFTSINLISVSSLILALESESVTFFKLMSVLNELSFLTLLWGRFEFPIRLSLFDVFQLFDSLILMCDITVVHLLFLDLYKTFQTYFLLDDVNTISIYLLLKNSTSVQSNFNLKVDKIFNAMSINHRLIKRKIKWLTQLSLKIIDQELLFVPLLINYNTQPRT